MDLTRGPELWGRCTCTARGSAHTAGISVREQETDPKRPMTHSAVCDTRPEGEHQAKRAQRAGEVQGEESG